MGHRFSSPGPAAWFNSDPKRKENIDRNGAVRLRTLGVKSR